MASWSLSVLIFAIKYHELNGEIIPCNEVSGACVCDAAVHGETCTLDCTANQAVCRHKVLTCRDGDPCIINCQKRRACQGASITCPANSDCTIHCVDPSDVCDGKSGGPFSITLNQAKNYQCIDGIAPNQGVCPPISENGDPYVPAPFTAFPTTAPTLPTSSPTTSIPTVPPTTSNPTTNEPTVSPSTAAPTITESQTTTIAPTRSPVTLNPSSPPTTNPSTSDPTTTPSTPPITAHPSTPFTTTLNPTDTPTTLHPATDAPTTIISTLSPNTPHPITNSPTFATSHPTIPTTTHPSVAPSTSTPTVDPTTQIPSISPITSYPTVYCTDWEITLAFTITQYPRNTAWKHGLKRIILNAFQSTILSQFDGTWHDHPWCVNMNIEITFLANRRRTLLQNSSDIHVESRFTFNTLLYEEYFDEYNHTTFAAGFQHRLMNAMGQNVDALVVKDAMEVSNTAIPTYPPHVLQTRKAGHNRETLIIVISSVFGVCCIIVCVYTCRMWVRHEIAYEDRYNKHQKKFNQHKKFSQNKKYAQVAPTTPSVTTGLDGAPVTPVPVTPVMDIETVQMVDTEPVKEETIITDEDVKIKKMLNLLSGAEAENAKIREVNKQTSFEIRLSNHKVKENSLMGHIITDLNLEEDAHMD